MGSSYTKQISSSTLTGVVLMVLSSTATGMKPVGSPIGRIRRRLAPDDVAEQCESVNVAELRSRWGKPRVRSKLKKQLSESKKLPSGPSHPPKLKRASSNKVSSLREQFEKASNANAARPGMNKSESFPRRKIQNSCQATQKSQDFFPEQGLADLNFDDSDDAVGNASQLTVEPPADQPPSTELSNPNLVDLSSSEAAAAESHDDRIDPAIPALSQKPKPRGITAAFKSMLATFEAKTDEVMSTVVEEVVEEEQSRLEKATALQEALDQKAAAARELASMIKEDVRLWDVQHVNGTPFPMPMSDEQLQMFLEKNRTKDCWKIREQDTNKWEPAATVLERLQNGTL